jgi:hypothetical protein
MRRARSCPWPGGVNLSAVPGRLCFVHPDSLESRVAALETQVGALVERVEASEQRGRASEQDAAAARVLAGAADRDVSEFRGELRDFRQAVASSFNGLREEMNERFARVDDGFTEVRGKLDAAAAGQQRIADLLTTLIERNH